MMKHVKHLCILTLSAALLIVSCSKNDSPATPDKTYKPLNNGLYVLNEGAYPAGVTSLTYYDSLVKTAATDIVKNVNDTTLGNVGNNIIAYGNKVYVVVNGSNLIAVLDKRTAQLIRQIKGSENWSPRYAISYNGKLLVSAYDGTVSVIDTSSLQITNTITVGATPEGLAVAGNYLYVANSGGLNYPNYDSTVSVVDLNTLKETKKIKVGINPQKVVTDSKGNVYIFVWGNYADASPKIYKIDASAQKVTDSSVVVPAYDKMIVYNDVLYFDGGNSAVTTINTDDLHGSFNDFVTDGTTLVAPYGIDVDDANGDVYVTDAIDFSRPGKVYCFDKNGKQKYNFTAGILPDKVVFLR